MTDTKKYNKLIILLIVSSMVVYGIKDIYMYTSSASYLASIFNCVIALLTYVTIYRQKIFSDFINQGSAITKFLSILIIMILFIYSSSFIAYVCELLQQFFMKKSPIYYLSLFLIFPCAVGAIYGFKTLSRYAVVIWILLLVSLSVLLVFSFDSYNLNNLFPVLGKDSTVLIYKSFDFSNYGIILIYYILLCDYNIESKSVTKNLFRIIITSGVISFLICLALNLILPQQVVPFSDNALLTIASSIKLNFLLERSEIIVLLLWVSLSFIIIGTLISTIYYLSQKTINITDKKGINYCCLLILYLLTLIINKFGITNICIQISKYSLFAMSLIMPILAFIRRVDVYD